METTPHTLSSGVGTLETPRTFEVIRIDETPFELSWVPPQVLHRDAQINYLTSTWEESVRCRASRNITLQGDFGTGKTVVTRYVLRNLAERLRAEGLKPGFAYIQCVKYDTTSRLIREILAQLGERPPGGLAKSDYVSMLENRASELDAVITVLDDGDKFLLKEKGDAETFLALPSRIIPNLSVTIVTNNYNAVLWLQNDLDTRFQDTFQQQPIGFSDYAPAELADILRERARIAFPEGVFEDGVMVYAAKRCFDLGLRARGLIRVGGIIYRRILNGTVAHVDMELVEEVLDNVRQRENIEPILNLDPASRAILIKVYVEERITSEGLLDWFSKEIAGRRIRGLSSQTFYAMAKRLKDLGLLAAPRTTRARRGKWTEIITINPQAHELVRAAYDDIRERGRAE